VATKIATGYVLRNPSLDARFTKLEVINNPATSAIFGDICSLAFGAILWEPTLNDRVYRKSFDAAVGICLRNAPDTRA